ncbi:MAG: hypothetical protein J1E95_04065, partial [Muribaculaceae bacterium]|nr:hypothetical protein [Muribaculaceae bacterium]
NSNLKLNACYIKLEEAFETQSGNMNINIKSFEAPNVSLKADNIIIKLTPDGLFKAENLVIGGNNANTRIIGGGNIVAKNIEITAFNNATNFADYFDGKVYNDWINKDNVARESTKGVFLSYAEGEKIDTPSCGSVEPEGPSLEMVARVVNHDHNSDKPSLRKLSATSITYGNGKFFASYHMRGTNYDNDEYDKGEEHDIEGCIESWTMNGENLTLGNWMWIDEMDFNHIYFDDQAESGKKVTVMGNHKNKGGIFGYVSENFSDDANIGDDNTLTYDPVKSSVRLESATGALQDYANGGDVNCAIRDNGSSNYLITTSIGYTAIDAATGKQLRNDIGNYKVPALNIFTDENGSVKHITKYNGGYAVLALDERKAAESDEISSPATVYYFSDETNFLNGTYNSSTKLPTEIRPIDGKNVLFAFNNELYACLGHGGLYRVNDGKSWQRPAEEKDETSTGNVPVNGVFADENYIYVANGSFLSVLNKDMEEIAYYHIPEATDGRTFSANFVYVRDGLIYVAFGQDGIRVLKLINA